MIKKTITDPISELLLLTPFVLDHRLKQKRKERENEVEKIVRKTEEDTGVWRQSVCQTCLCSLYECSNIIMAISGQCLEVTHTHTCSEKVGEWMQLKSLRLSCSMRSLMVPSTTSTLFSWRSFTASRVTTPPGLASANRRSSWVAVEMAWPGGSSL